MEEEIERSIKMMTKHVKDAQRLGMQPSLRPLAKVRKLLRAAEDRRKTEKQKLDALETKLSGDHDSLLRRAKITLGVDPAVNPDDRALLDAVFKLLLADVRGKK